jgi:hypothetical protein
MRILGDRLLLVVSALAVGAVLFGWMFVADRQLGLAREQQFFVGGALVYSVGTLYFLRPHVLHRLDRRSKQILAVIVVEFPVVLFLILFSLGALPWPRSMLAYVAGSILIAPVVIFAVDWLFRPRA